MELTGSLTSPQNPTNGLCSAAAECCPQLPVLFARLKPVFNEHEHSVHGDLLGWTNMNLFWMSFKC